VRKVQRTGKRKRKHNSTKKKSGVSENGEKSGKGSHYRHYRDGGKGKSKGMYTRKQGEGRIKGTPSARADHRRAEGGVKGARKLKKHSKKAARISVFSGLGREGILRRGVENFGRRKKGGDIKWVRRGKTLN